MNCRRIEKFLPLYVEGDLKTSRKHRIAAHLEECGKCSRLAEGYSASQSWLRSLTTPEFDPAFLDGIKSDVMSRIDKSAQKNLPGSFQLFSRRPVLALTAALLIIFGVLVVYLNRARLNSRSVDELAIDLPREVPNQPPISKIKPKKALRADFVRSRYHLTTRHSKPLYRAPFAPVLSHNDTVAHGDSSSRNSEAPLRFGDSTEMLRIELQTSDPHIRIIWFAPKETDSHQFKPATD